MESKLSSSRKIKQFRIDSTLNVKDSLKESDPQQTTTASVKLIIESIPSGAILYTGGELFINQRADDLLGGSEEHSLVFQENLSQLFQLKSSLQSALNSKERSSLAEIWFKRGDGGQHLCEVTLPNNTEQELWLINDITAQRQNERLLHLLSNATSGVTGGEFFKRLVKELADALKLKGVLLVQHRYFYQQIKKCQTNGAFIDGELIPDFEYDATGSPCENAMGPDCYVIHSGVSKLFPNDKFLVDHQVEAYFSLPMINRRGEVQGHVVLLSDRPIHENLCEIPAIKNYTFRAATELSREQAEKKLQESELRMTLAARGSDIGLWDYNLVTGQVNYDDHWYAMLGYQPGEFLATFDAWKKLVHSDDLPSAMKLLEDYLAGNASSFEAEIRMKHKNGDWKWILTRGKVSAVTPQQTPLQVTGTHLDIDDLKRSQQIRLENEARLRIIMDQIPAILWTTDCNNQYTSIVGAGLNQLGIQPNEPVGQAIFDFQDVPDVSENMVAMHERTLKGESVRFEQQLQNTILDIHIEPLRNSDDVIIGCIGLAIDVTVRKKTIEQLNRQRILLQTIFHSVTDAMIVTDRSHNIVMCNESIQIHFRCKEADLLGRPIREIITSGDQFDDEFLRVSYPNSRVLKPFIVEYLRADGTQFQGETIVTPLRRSDNQITGYIQVIRDITDRIQIEEEKDQLHAQMLHAQKLESLGVLAGGIAHDFNNLLLAILGNTNLALMELKDNSTVIENVKNIEIAARHATKICERLLAYSGRRTFVTTTFNLNQIIQETVEILKSIVSPNADIVLELSDDKLLIHGDMGQIEQVVLNLLTNASEAIQNQKEAGVIHVRTGIMTLTPENSANYFFCENISPGQFVYFEIEDTGSGMDEDCQSKMFDPFFTTKFTGRGLGLAGVSGIIRGHNGGLYVESTVEHGSCFRVILPVATEAEEKIESDSSVDTVVPADAGYVLVIDDDKAVCNVVNHVLNRFGFSVMVAHSGNEGIDVYEKNRDGISVILLDMTMPGLSGVETYHLLKEKGIDIPVVLTSGLSETDISDQMEGSEFLHFLKKPYKPQKLVNMVSKALLRHQIHDDSTIHFK
ncbi:hybrid sensor histidine kinase/response regulator [Gimesia fumaroli]|uniref:histidine kinase n=1 Tax=Gimesia fumaroli TaxID=2527976 RepID=A0A518IEI1_9PLAN|nr:PAS domain S-box protein [Gimesia fumaroli]QDV51504.1 Blue-light-activated protein [Gimesia fumaroli]